MFPHPDYFFNRYIESNLIEKTAMEDDDDNAIDQ